VGIAEVRYRWDAISQDDYQKTKLQLLQFRNDFAQAAANNQVVTDVHDAYDGLEANDQVVELYLSGYLAEAQAEREIPEYSRQRGVASLIDFLDAERSYRATQLAYRQTAVSYLIALEQLREAVRTRSLT
jgi:outer membrane protein, heavy metal efflux system